MLDTAVVRFIIMRGRLRRLLPLYRIHRQNPISFQIGGDQNAKEEQQHERDGAVINDRFPIRPPQRLGALSQERWRYGGGDGVI